MRQSFSEKIAIPEGVLCSYSSDIFSCSKSGSELKRLIKIPGTIISISGNEIEFSCKKANKNDIKIIKANLAHMRNMFRGLNKKYTYSLEAVNVHFPMILKLDKNKLIISNFLGEKVSRHATILPNVDVQIKGAKITITSNDKEAAGQTAANIEKASIVRNRDRRVFKDGIYIIEKPGRAE